MSPDVFEINEDKMNRYKYFQWILPNGSFCYVKDKIVGPVRIVQDH